IGAAACIQTPSCTVSCSPRCTTRRVPETDQRLTFHRRDRGGLGNHPHSMARPAHRLPCWLEDPRASMTFSTLVALQLDVSGFRLVLAFGWHAPGCLGSTRVKMVTASVTAAGTRARYPAR